MRRPHPRSTLFPYTTLFRSICVTLSGPLQSVTTTLPVKSGTAAWQFAFAEAFCDGAQVAMAGGVSSVTVKVVEQLLALLAADRKSTRLNSSHQIISYAVFCLNAPSPPPLYTLSLHDALPIYLRHPQRPVAIGNYDIAGEIRYRRLAVRIRRSVLRRSASRDGRRRIVRDRESSGAVAGVVGGRSEEHTSELQSPDHLVCRLLLECAVPTPALHSFPTRRSSDLSASPSAARCNR